MHWQDAYENKSVHAKHEQKFTEVGMVTKTTVFPATKINYFKLT